MSTLRTCPRCGRVVRPPSLATGVWTCSEHGGVVPVTPAQAASAALITRVGEQSRVPIWLPRPLAADWVVSGLAWAGDDPGGVVATVLAVSGPHPIPEAADGDPAADLLLIAETPGVGLGAHLAGLSSVDAGPMLRDKVEHERAEAHVVVEGAEGGHEVPLWSVLLDDGLGYVGEAAGVWLWLLAWPATTAAVLLDGFTLVDARDPEQLFDVPMGALTPRLR
ncbi:DUF6758 family protein [Spongisporangium articulatum]|uniref:DUF6758 family protein n=1 Tax=Spongisporangium articulatum TaxID=3362603 RepID=A0ABW8AS64_9ACTN